MMHEAYILRTTDFNNNKVWWISDNKNTVKGRKGMSKQQVKKAFESRSGKPDIYYRYTGLLRISEAVMTVINLQEQIEISTKIQ